MFDVLRAYIAGIIELSDEEFDQAAVLFVPKRVERGEFLLREGGHHNNNAFVTRGCLRLYSIGPKGEEHIVQFAIEHWWIADFYSMLTGEPAKYNIDAIEDSEVLLLSGKSRERLCATIPKFERFFRILLERNYVAMQRRVHGALSLSVEEQYLLLQRSYPAILSRVPLNMVASYLGITPQSLSRIRREIAGKK